MIHYYFLSKVATKVLLVTLAVTSCSRDSTKTRLKTTDFETTPSSTLDTEGTREQQDIPYAISVSCARGAPIVATGGADGRITVWNSLSGTATKEIMAGADLKDIGFSPDDRTLFSVGEYGHGIRTWDIAGGSPIWTSSSKEDGTDCSFSACYSKDGTRMAVALCDLDLVVVDSSTGRIRTRMNGKIAGSRIRNGVEAYEISFTPNGEQVLTPYRESEIGVWDVATGNLEASMGEHHDTVTSVVVHPSGNGFFSVGLDELIIHWQTAENAPMQKIAGGSNGLLSFAFSSSGDVLASLSGDGTINVWGLKNGTTIEKLDVRTVAEGASEICFTADGRNILAGGWQPFLWEIREDRKKLLGVPSTDSSDRDADGDKGPARDDGKEGDD